ncbi:MAG TPA: DAK2 domain-containing protein [Epulopiscium sp.]|nr:DAK2 domain-containing protein [Candidatus Epulonipiscium sp.]
MKIESINASILKQMFAAGANRLDANKQMVNDLNVFPVPDGDTGTNMSLTFLAALREVENVEEDTVHAVAKAASSGSLRGARGNSGVILSQIVRGFYSGLKGHETADAMTLAHAMQQGADTAYKAVMKPKEGTILTVARALASKAMEVALESDDILENLKEIVKYGREVLDQTPDMLPVLKEAGVVDAGGEGLMCIVEGALTVLTGESNTYVAPVLKEAPVFPEHVHNFNVEDIIFGYCTEFIVNRTDDKAYNEEEMKEYLSGIGDSIVVVSDDDFVKVHVHTDNPGQALEKAISIGSLSNIKIDNMREQHMALVAKQKPSEPSKSEEKIDIGFVSIAAGKGIAEIMGTLGITEIIEGGQTMNPSTDDILHAIEKCHAKTVVVLPNNKNILLAAEQAAKIAKDVKVYVLPTKTIPQGISAMIAYNPGADIESMLGDMNTAISNVKTGQITHAVRDTMVDGKAIKEGNFLGILDDTIEIVAETLEDAAKQLVEAMVDEDSEIISMYYGSEVDEQVANQLQEHLETSYVECDIEAHSGGQPVYYYIISVE